MENEMLNTIEDETHEEQEETEDKHPEKGLLRGGSDEKRFGP